MCHARVRKNSKWIAILGEEGSDYVEENVVWSLTDILMGSKTHLTNNEHLSSSNRRIWMDYILLCAKSFSLHPFCFNLNFYPCCLFWRRGIRRRRRREKQRRRKQQNISQLRSSRATNQTDFPWYLSNIHPNECHVLERYWFGYARSTRKSLARSEGVSACRLAVSLNTKYLKIIDSRYSSLSE